MFVSLLLLSLYMGVGNSLYILYQYELHITKTFTSIFAQTQKHLISRKYCFTSLYSQKHNICPIIQKSLWQTAMYFMKKTWSFPKMIKVILHMYKHCNSYFNHSLSHTGNLRFNYLDELTIFIILCWLT